MPQSKKGAFLEAYKLTGNITAACQAAQINRRTYYRWCEHDDRFALEAKQAEIEAADHLEAEARRRAVEGTDEPVFYQGEKCGVIRRYSDTLLIFLLKGARPEKYKDRHEFTGANGGPIEFSRTTDSELLRELATLLETARARAARASAAGDQVPLATASAAEPAGAGQ